MSKYRIYIDEVGNPDLESSENPNHRFLSLTGIIADLDYVRTTIQPELEALKESLFLSHPDDPVVLHRKELLGGKPPFLALRDPKVRTKFNEKLLQHFSNWEYAVVTVCLDKLMHKQTYSTWRYDPYHYCLAVLLERYVFFLEQQQACGDVMAESRGGKEDSRLKRSFKRLWSQGTEYVDSERIQKVLTSQSLKVKPKTANVACLQIADLIAHPSRNEVLIENGHDTLIRLAPFGSQIVELIQAKYYQKEGNVYGKKYL
ncbi:MAG: DUF3800 domain-containing protein [Candidatus Lokiarchaeota archaeon]|nr:DUF3800 domain-containing protein [Candidatus Lokiarchaeota archaeon]